MSSSNQPYNSLPEPDDRYASLSPLSRNSSSDPLLSSEKSLFEQAIPEPSAPRAWLRTLATAVLLLFAIVVVWMAFAGTGRSELGQSSEGGGWVNFKSVPWGETTMGSYQSYSQEQSAEPTSEGASTDSSFESSTDGEEPQAQLAVGEPSQGAFSAEKSAAITALLASGTISDYVWHEQLEDWSAANAEGGRLVVVGDIHGQAESLTSLLARLSYAPQSDTLVHVGDLVSKAPLNQSLETVRLMRTYGAKGVRGNHDQGVLEWRNWMAAHGTLVASASTANGEEPQRLGQDGAGVWAGYGVPGEDVTMAQEGQVNKRLAKRGWFPWTSSSDDEAEAEDEEAYEDEEAIDGDALGEFAEAVNEEQGEANASIEIAPLPGYEGDNFDSSTSSSSDDVDSSDSTSASSAGDSTVSHMFDATASAFSSLKDASSDVSEPFSGAPDGPDGSFFGAGWEWLDTPVEELAALGVVVPEGWNWGGDWFEIARNLPKADADYLAALPLTLHIEELNTFVVHAGMLPWTNSAASTAASDSTSPLFEPLTSTSLSSFVPTDASLLSSPSQSLLLVSQNANPFTLLNMRAVKQSRKFHEMIVTNSRKGTPWHSIWNSGMEECEKAEGCEPVSLLYGHWAGRGLEVKKNSIGLDSACAAGKRLSALVLSSTSSASPLSTPATPLAAFRLLSAPSLPLVDLTNAFSSPVPEPVKEEVRGLFEPWTRARGPKLRKRLLEEVKAAVVRKREMRKEGKLVKRGWWSSEPVVETAEQEQEAEVVQAGSEEVVEEVSSGEIAKEEEEEEEEEDLDEDDFEAQEVALAGKGAWVVSVACGTE